MNESFDRDFDRTAIRRLRKSRNMTLAEFGRRMGKSRAHVDFLENHNGYPNIKTMLEIMNTFGVDESYFFTGEIRLNEFNDAA